MTDAFETATVGEIVATDFRTAAVLEAFGIDFCCGGRRPLVDACHSAGVDPAKVIRELQQLARSPRGDDDAAAWPLDRLIDHIVTVHHAYVRQALPTIARYLAKLREVHGQRHPELARVAQVFSAMHDELSQHMLKEEQVLFPYIRDLLEPDRRGSSGVQSPFGTVEDPIRMMEREHQEAADALRTIRTLTGGYVAPADGCTTYQVRMAELDRFERDLHRHVHLENNVLFPRAVALESSRWRLHA